MSVSFSIQITHDQVFPEIRVHPFTRPREGDFRNMASLALSWPVQKTGDPLFDRRYGLSADSFKTLALATAEIRPKLLLLNGLEISASRLILRGGINHERLMAAIEIAEHLLHTSPMDAALTNLGDPMPGVRHNNLQILAQYYMDRPGVKEGLVRHLEQEKNAENRMLAASILQEQGIPFLVEMLGRPEGVTAIRYLASIGTPQALDIIRDIPRGNYPLSVIAEAIATIGEKKMKDAEDVILNAVNRCRTPLIEATAAQSLGHIGTPLSEPFLLDLSHHQEATSREAAVLALARCGTIDAVSRLREMRRDGSEKVREQIESAILNIQYRQGDVQQGMLTLTHDDSTGGLTLNDGDIGGLTLETDNR